MKQNRIVYNHLQLNELSEYFLYPSYTDLISLIRLKLDGFFSPLFYG